MEITFRQGKQKEIIFFNFMQEEIKNLAKILLKNGKIASPRALMLIKEKNLLDEILELEEVVIDEEILKKLEKSEEKKVEIIKDRKRKISEEYTIDFKIQNAEVKHIERKTSDFVNYFNSRYKLLQSMLVKRVNPISIANIKKTRNDEISLIGMVYDVRSTTSGNKIIELEDPTGKISCMITKNSNEDIVKEVDEILRDEIIGVKGIFKNNYVFITEIIRPDVPITNNNKKLDVPLSCVFISDLHVGSIDFLESVFKKFLNWLKSKEAESVKYIFVAGDVVDGIGIYLSQDKDLSIKSGNKQYEYTVELLKQIPEHIKIIIQPGNHDIVGNHEPQRTLEETSLVQLSNIIFGTNPCWVYLDKLKILMYHGYSYDNLIRDLPSIRHKGYSEPTLPMIESLKRRHLAPIYGSSLVIPEYEDYLVINELPDIFHSGHLHTVGVTNYRNVLIINSGTFQGQTKFQEMLGHIPHPGIFVKVNLQTKETKMINLNGF
jgi:DNA polymerase II small subunit